MLKQYLVFGFLFFPYLVDCNNENNLHISFISDFILKQNKKQIVNIFLCWSTESTINLLNNIFEKSTKIAVTNLNVSETYNNSFESGIYVLDFSCENSRNLLHWANNKNLFKFQYHWLILLKSEDKLVNKFIDFCTQLNILLDSRFVYAESINFKYTLTYIYKIRKKSECLKHELAIWEYQKGFLFYEEITISRKRRNLNGYTLTSATVFLDNETYINLYNYRNNQIDTASKVCFVLLTYIIDYMNASHNLIFPSIWEPYNDQTDNNETETLMGMIKNNIADISGSVVRCIPERLPFSEFIQSPLVLKCPFIFRQRPLSYVKNIYVLPFDSMLWFTDISFILISSLLLFLIALWEWKIINDNNLKPDYDMIEPTFSEALLFTISVVSQQGYATEPKGLPGKILILTLFFTLIFLFTAYSAYTVVLFQSTADDIKNLNDLYHSKIELGIENRPYMQTLFKRYKDGIRKKLYQEKIAITGEPVRSYSLSEGVEKLRNEYFAFSVGHIFGYKQIDDTFLDHEKCGLEEVEAFPALTLWVVCPKKSPFSENFRIGYYRMAESGLTDREKKRRINAKPKCVIQGNNYRRVGINDLYPLYILLISGLVVTIVLFIFELLMFHDFLLFKVLEFKCKK